MLFMLILKFCLILILSDIFYPILGSILVLFFQVCISKQSFIIFCHLLQMARTRHTARKSDAGYIPPRARASITWEYQPETESHTDGL